MSEAATGKSRGLKFAEQQLLRHGWEQGKGLGRAENGISEAIRVKVKCDKGGVGHKESEQFTFHWWDHVFNKTSASLAVESDQNGVVVKKMEEGEDGTISNKKPRKAMMNKSMLYGCFVKSATLLSGEKQPEEKLSLSEDSSSEDEEKLDLSSTKNLSDAQLMKACGGRTAHKGARHGFTMSAKLARLEQQEQAFMAKYGKKKQTDKTIPLNEAVPTKLSPALDQERAEKSKQKKGKKKKQRSDKHKENGIQDNNEASQKHNEEISKKRKKQIKGKTEFESEAATDSFVDPASKKKKTKLVLEKESTEKSQEADAAEIAEHQPTEESISKKKRKKKHSKKKSSALLEAQSQSTVLVCEKSAEETEKCEQEQHEEGTAALPPAPDACKKKKKKSSKANNDKSPATKIDTCYSLDTCTAEVLQKDQSQSKKRNRREVELEAETENGSINQPTEKKKKKKKKKHVQ